MNRETIIEYILDSRKAGRTKDQIFEDLVDNYGVDGVTARVMVESTR